MIEIQGLTHAFKKQKALDHISLHIPNGLVGLLGENGAGKTTLMKIIATLIPIQSGSINVEGNRLELRNYNDIRKIIGFMPQEFDFFPNFTVREIMEYHCLISGVDKKSIRQETDVILSAINLKRFSNKKTKDLSGGMKRRLGLGCVLINNPRILIVDEPTVGLDPEERINIRNHLKVLSKDKTIILSTHIVDDIYSICNNLIVLSEGHLIYSGGIDNFVEQSPNVYEIECAINDMDRYKEIGVITDVQYQNNDCIIKLVTRKNIENAKLMTKTLETAYMFSVKEKFQLRDEGEDKIC